MQVLTLLPVQIRAFWQRSEASWHHFFAPLGFGDWRVSTALITGFMAKESVVSTLTVLLGGNTALLQDLFTPFTAYVFLDLYLALYTLCCSYCNCAAGNGNCKSCRWYCSSTVCHCMDRCVCGTWCGNDAWIIEKIPYIWHFHKLQENILQRL